MLINTINKCKIKTFFEEIASQEPKRRLFYEGKAGQDKGTAIQDLRDRNLATEERLLGQLFRGYFNNKMTVLVFLIQVKQHKPEARVINGVCCFLDDLYHHMLADSKQKRYRRVFIWFKKFAQKLPNVKASQRGRALDFVRVLYEVFGINLKSEITGERT